MLKSASLDICCPPSSSGTTSSSYGKPPMMMGPTCNDMHEFYE
jgi:hypothetical protein